MGRRNGTILVTTLWILALLTLLALGIGTRMGIDVKIMGYSVNRIKARYLARAGILRCANIIESDGNKNLDYLKELWSAGYDYDEEKHLLKAVPLGEGHFTVSHILESGEGVPTELFGASDEEALVNVNKADDDMLSRLPGFTAEIVAAVIDWRDEDGAPYNYAGSRGAETDYYENEIENPYPCKNAPFSVPEELLLVRGITLSVYEGVKDLITVFGNDAAVNVNTASYQVLDALTGDVGFEERPMDICIFRNGPDMTAGTEDDEVINDIKFFASKFLLNERQMKYFKMNTNTFRVRSTGSVKGGKVRQTIETVLSRSGEGFEYLYYHED